MAIRYIGVDSGKFATKVAEYDPKTETIRKFSIRTKASEGDFRDDAIEAHTVIVDINGQPLKVGNGARGDGAALDTDKKTDIHKMCVMTALATLASAKEKDENKIAQTLKAMPFKIDNLITETAKVTIGGVKSNEINSKTLESKYVEGLYFVGELLEMAGPTGGYNLEIAFSTGYLAAQEAVKSLKD